MRKNDLIKKLQAIKGNPEVLLWNGMVGDWMQIGGFKESHLVKVTKECWIRSIENEEIGDRHNPEYRLPPNEITQLEKSWAKSEWEHNPHVTQEDVKKGRYKTKPVIYIDAKKRGVNTFDRIGGSSY